MIRHGSKIEWAVNVYRLARFASCASVDGNRAASCESIGVIGRGACAQSVGVHRKRGVQVQVAKQRAALGSTVVTGFPRERRGDRGGLWWRCPFICLENELADVAANKKQWRDAKQDVSYWVLSQGWVTAVESKIRCAQADATIDFQCHTCHPFCADQIFHALGDFCSRANPA